MIALDENDQVILTDEIPEIRQFIVREIKDVHEFEELFHLRYRVYRDSRLASFCPTTESEVDINAYDLTSRHLGLFVRERGIERLVGCCRGVTGELSPYRKAIEDVATEFGINCKSLPGPVHRYSCLEHLPDCDRLSRYYAELQRHGHRILEASRLCIDEDARSLAVSRFFLECVFSYFVLHLGYDTGICYVAASQQRFYESYGFTLIPGFPLQQVTHARLALAPLHVINGKFSQSKSDRLSRVAQVFNRQCQVVLDRHFTGQVPEERFAKAA